MFGIFKRKPADPDKLYLLAVAQLVTVVKVYKPDWTHIEIDRKGDGVVLKIHSTSARSAAAELDSEAPSTHG